MDHAIEFWGHPSLTFSLRRFAPCCEISLLPPYADRFAYRSKLVVCLRKQRLSLICAVAYTLRPVALGHFHELEPHPLRSMLIDVCLRKHQWRRSVPGFQLNSLCHINNQCMEPYPRTPSAKTTHKIPTNVPTKNSNTLENGLVPPCSILLPNFFFKILTTGTKGGIIPKSEGIPDVKD